MGIFPEQRERCRQLRGFSRTKLSAGTHAHTHKWQCALCWEFNSVRVVNTYTDRQLLVFFRDSSDTNRDFRWRFRFIHYCVMWFLSKWLKQLHEREKGPLPGTGYKLRSIHFSPFQFTVLVLTVPVSRKTSTVDASKKTNNYVATNSN